MTEFGARYREMADEEIMELYMDRDGLEPVAQAAVVVEFQTRGLKPEDALALKQSLVEERQKIERKQRRFLGWLSWIGHR